MLPIVNNIVLTESPLEQSLKTTIQRVYEYVAGARRAVSTREVITALPDATRSSITFALTRLVREGDIKRRGHGRYTLARESDDPTIALPDDDAYLFSVLERVRTVLSFADLAFLYEVIEASRRLTPEVFRAARERSKRATEKH